MAFSEPEQIIATLDLRDGMHIADIGAGSGFYSIAAAKAVAPSGKVFAIDIQKDLLDRLSGEAERQNVSGITTVWGNAEDSEGTRLRPDSIDLVIIANTLFQIEDKSAVVSEVDRILKPDGRVLVVDWSESFDGLGPQPDQIVSLESVESIFSQRGFIRIGEVPVGDHHYGLILSK